MSTIELLHRYRASDQQAATIDLVVAGEGAERDPMQARRVTAGEDTFGILGTFGGA